MSEGASDPGPRTFYDRANELRRAGRHSEAIAVYEDLRQRFAGSAAARNATYNIGETYLQNLGQPVRALRAFESYLAEPGGAVRQEAMLGRIEALGRLGRRDAERQAIEDYLQRYPEGLASSRLRERLE
jgi:TolA-binding protein